MPTTSPGRPVRKVADSTGPKERVHIAIHVELPEPRAAVLEKAIRPEIRGGSSKVRAEVKLSKGGVTINLDAEKLSEARAALNSYLRLISVSEETVRVSSELG